MSFFSPFTPSRGCICDPEYHRGHRFNTFFGEYFGICLYTPRDLIGTSIGMFNLIIITLIQLPQVIYNYKRKDCTEMSLSMLMFWNVGDLCGLVSLILTGQMKTTNFIQQLYTTSVDLTLTVQYFLYQKKPVNRDESLLSINAENGNTLISMDDNIVPFDNSSSSQSLESAEAPKNFCPSSHSTSINFTQHQDQHQHSSPISKTSTKFTNPLLTPSNIIMIIIMISFPIFIPSVTALAPLTNIFPTTSTAATPTPCETGDDPSHLEKIIGPIFGWIMACIYTPSQFPQVYSNYKNKSGESMSPVGLGLTIIAYTLWYVSIFLPTKASDDHHYGKDFFLNTFPFVFSYFFCMMNCYIMLFQRFYYQRQRRSRDETDYVHAETEELEQHQQNNLSIQPLIVTKNQHSDSTDLIPTPLTAHNEFDSMREALLSSPHVD